MRFLLAYCGIAAALLSAAASSSAGRSVHATMLRADVAEWNIVPSAGVVPAGRVLVDVHNVGATAHQVELVKTATFDARLRLSGARADARPLAAVVVRAGERATFAVTLTSGSYLLLDNLPWHYWKGTSAAFSVR